jgi:DNA (cytosine-5)-methyltransferase 1
MTRPTVADFFSGAGGFSEGFNRAGFDVVFSLDNWKPAVETHKWNYPEEWKCVHLNILNLDTPEKIDAIVPDTDIIIGSPPCISFSNSNKAGKADKTLGVQLIHQYLKIILHKKTKSNSILKYWIMENVPNSLLFVKDTYTAKELGLKESLPNLVIKQKHLLTASDYGSPQGRKRAIAGDYPIPEKTNTKKNVLQISDVLFALGPPENNKKNIIHDPSYPNISLNHELVTDHFYDSELPEHWIQKARRLKVDHGYMGKMDFPDKLNRLCRTIMATESYCSRESIIFPKEKSNQRYRAPTIRELACLMGFPIDYQFIGNSSTIKHKLIGNAVCVHLSYALANAIKSDMNITMTRNVRNVVDPPLNLNKLKVPLFSEKKETPKKMNSKYHVHVPFLKIKQFRVELSNEESNFENGTYIWKSYLHRGSGKNAKKIRLQNSMFLSDSEYQQPYVQNMIDFMHKECKPYLYNPKIFQQKNCRILENSNHLSPDKVLQIISDKIHSYECINDTCSIPKLDEMLGYSKSVEYPKPIILALIAVNEVENFIHKKNE